MVRYVIRLENDPQLTPQDYQELAILAEDRGYETVWVPEGGGRDSLTSLASIALRTERITLGTGILPIFARTPIQHRNGRRRDGRSVRQPVHLGLGRRPPAHG